MRHEPTRRLFIAIELPQDVRAALRNAMDSLQRAGLTAGLQWVRPDGIHLTLKFLGATAESQVPAIGAALRRASAGATAFDLRPEGFGTFPEILPHRRENRRLRVLWVGMAGDTALLSVLAERVERALAPLGYPSETRPYFPHLTLARVRDTVGQPTVDSICAALKPYLPAAPGNTAAPITVPTFPAFRAEHVALMESKLAPGGAEYRALETFALDG